MKRLMMAVVAAFASACAFGDIAGYIEGTVLTVPAGETVTAGADDAATVGTLTQVVFADAAGVFEMKDGTFAFAAAVSGAGTVKATDAAGLTVSGDSRGFTGGWDFNNSPVIVASRYGLGDANTTAAISRASTDSKGSSPGAGFYWLTFEGAGLENDVPLTLYGCHALTKPGAGAFVQNSLVTLNPMAGSGQMYIDLYVNSDWTMKEGFWLDDNLNKWPRPYIACGSRLTTKFLHAKGRTIYIYSQGTNGAGTLVLTDTGSDWGTLHIGQRICLITEADEALGSSLNLNFAATSACTLDLAGHDQTIARAVYASTQPTATSALVDGGCVKSASPATLTVTGANQLKHNLIRFQDQASFAYATSSDETIPFYFSRQVSTSAGALTVSSGLFVFEWGAGWRGANAIVDGGVLQLDSTESFKDDSTELTVASPGKVVIGSDVLACFSAATIGGVSIAKGTYTVAELTAAYPATKGLVEGEGSISIDEHTPEIPPYEGDLEIAGTVATVPRSCIVTLTDADADTVEGLTEIRFLNSVGEVRFENALTKISLAAAISGGGTIRCTDSAGLVLSGDSRNFAGEWEFRNSHITVASRYGLGGTATKGATSYSGFGENGADSDALVFEGEGLTCDVPLTVFDKHAFVAADDGILVLNGNLKFLPSSSGKNYAYLDIGNIQFNGGISIENTKVWPSFQLSSGGSAWVSGIAASGAWFCMNGGISGKVRTYHIAGTGNMWGDGRLNFAKLVCENAYCLAMDRPCYFCGNNGDVIDLNGFDQQVALYYGATAPTEGGDVPSGGVVTSSVPATITISGTPTEGKHNAIRFRGAVDVNYASTATWRLSKTVSDTTGTLSVSAGTFIIEWGAQWKGPEVAVDGGVLELASVNALLDDTTKLTVKSGKLKIDEGVVAYVSSATFGDSNVPKGVYETREALIAVCPAADGLFEGEGTLAVAQHGGGSEIVAAEWTGSGADAELTTDANWLGDHAPDLVSGGADITFGTYSQKFEANVSGALAAYALKFSAGADFTLTGSDNAVLTLGAGGLSTVGADFIATVAADVLFPISAVGPWNLASGTELNVSGRLAGGAASLPLMIGGEGVVRLSGDNSSLKSPIQIRAEDNKSKLEVHIHSSRALGTEPAVLRAPKVRFHCLTNDTPIVVNAYKMNLDSAGGAGKRLIEDGETLVLNGRYSTEDTIGGTIRANGVTFRGGLCGNSGHFAIGVDQGYVGRIENKPFDVTPAKQQYSMGFCGAGVLELDVGGNDYYRIVLEDSVTLKTTRSDVLNHDYPFCFGTSVAPCGTLDLDGNDQTAAFLSHQMWPDNGSVYYGVAVDDATKFGTVTSAADATLFLTGVDNDIMDSHGIKRSSPTNCAVCFRGRAGLTYSGPAGSKQSFLYRRSDTAGKLRVTSGTVSFEQGAGWSMVPEVVIEGTGRIVADAASAPTLFGKRAGRSRAVLRIRDSGALEIPAGTMVTVKELYIGDQSVPMPIGTYHGGDVDWLVGGDLEVRGNRGLVLFVR